MMTPRDFSSGYAAAGDDDDDEDEGSKSSSDSDSDSDSIPPLEDPNPLASGNRFSEANDLEKVD